MSFRAIVLVAILASTALAGCIENPLDRAGLADVSRSLSIVAEEDWSATPGFTIVGRPIVDEGFGALAFEWTGRAEGAGGFILRLKAPEGTSYPVASVSGGGTGSERASWTILPAVPGMWEIAIETTGGSSGLGSASGTYRLSAVPERPAPRAVAGEGPDTGVVVAVVDTGVNPYHDVFQRGIATRALPPRVVEADSGAAPLSLDVARGEDHVASVKGDAALWAQVPGRTLVHFSGTNVLGYHVDETTLPALPVLDRAGHGTGVLNSVLSENPDALVVMISGSDWDEGVRWAARQPWIDVISLSWGPAVNAAGVANAPSCAAGGVLGCFDTVAATREAHAAGKLVFTASGNDPTLTFTDTTSGPPWVHAVSGAQPTTRARAFLSGNMVDSVANWTQELARHDSLDESRVMSGTSFATPTTAGIASRIILETRAGAGHSGGIADGALVSAGGVTATGRDVRDALNATAVYWSTADYGGPGDPGPSVPVAPAPWTSMGWGYLDGSAVAPAVAALLGEAALPVKPAEAAAFMAANQRAREEWWSQQ